MDGDLKKNEERRRIRGGWNGDGNTSEWEFENKIFHRCCNENGIFPNLSTPWTLQQDDVVEKKNMSLKEMTRTILNDY